MNKLNIADFVKKVILTDKIKKCRRAKNWYLEEKLHAFTNQSELITKKEGFCPIRQNSPFSDFIIKNKNL